MLPACHGCNGGISTGHEWMTTCHQRTTPVIECNQKMMTWMINKIEVQHDEVDDVRKDYKDSANNQTMHATKYVFSSISLLVELLSASGSFQAALIMLSIMSLLYLRKWPSNWLVKLSPPVCHDGFDVGQNGWFWDLLSYSWVLPWQRVSGRMSKWQWVKNSLVMKKFYSNCLNFWIQIIGAYHRT